MFSVHHKNKSSTDRLGSPICRWWSLLLLTILPHSPLLQSSWSAQARLQYMTMRMIFGSLIFFILSLRNLSTCIAGTVASGCRSCWTLAGLHCIIDSVISLCNIRLGLDFCCFLWWASPPAREKAYDVSCGIEQSVCGHPLHRYWILLKRLPVLKWCWKMQLLAAYCKEHQPAIVPNKHSTRISPTLPESQGHPLLLKPSEPSTPMKNSHYEGQQQMQGHTDRTNTNLHTVWLSNSRRVQVVSL